MDLDTLDLAENEKDALRRLVAYLHATFPEKIESICLYGSKARGDSQPESDIDVLIIAQDDDDQLQYDISTEAARISIDCDVILGPLVIGVPRWEEMRGFTLYRNVARDAAGLDLDDGELVLEPAGIT